jgi:hypothetical protein
MPLPTDRGFAVLRRHSDGSVTVEVCAAVENGQAVDIHARHARQPAVRVDPAVTLVDTGKVSYTTQIVEVFGGGDAITVRHPAGLIRPTAD